MNNSIRFWFKNKIIIENIWNSSIFGYFKIHVCDLRTLIFNFFHHVSTIRNSKFVLKITYLRCVDDLGICYDFCFQITYQKHNYIVRASFSSSEKRTNFFMTNLSPWFLLHCVFLYFNISPGIVNICCTVLILTDAFLYYLHGY